MGCYHTLVNLAQTGLESRVWILHGVKSGHVGARTGYWINICMVSGFESHSGLSPLHPSDVTACTTIACKFFLFNLAMRFTDCFCIHIYRTNHRGNNWCRIRTMTNSTTTWVNLPSDTCAKWSLKSAWASANFDQYSLSAWRNFASLTSQNALSKDSDQRTHQIISSHLNN